MLHSKYVISKIDGNQYCLSNGQFQRHLDSYGLTKRDYYEIYELGHTPLCQCLKPLTFYSKKHVYANSCGKPECVGKTISQVKSTWDQKKKSNINGKISETWKKKDRGRMHEKVKETSLVKYGVEWPSQASLMKKKAEQTKTEKYGDPYFNNSKKASATRINFSVERKNEINDKRRNTFMKRYGVENNLQIDAILKKTKIHNGQGRPYFLPSGQKIGIRGYEDKCLNILFNLKQEYEVLHESQKRLVFEYINSEQRRCKYTPDIYLPEENKIIEVKSYWWFDGHGDPKYQSRYLNNMRKKQACLDSGYEFEFWLWNEKNKDFDIL